MYVGGEMAKLNGILSTNSNSYHNINSPLNLKGTIITYKGLIILNMDNHHTKYTYDLYRIYL